MKLVNIFENINYQLISGSMEYKIENIYFDSRKVKSSSLFVCLVGASSDGHDYIDSAVSKGATAIVISREIDFSKYPNITFIKVNDTRKTLAKIACNFYRNPSKELTTIAITGTKGKTSTSFFIKSILECSSKKVGIIGTMGVFYGSIHYDTENTTPESLDIQKYLREMADNKIKYVIMEVSSQALKYGRVENMFFDYGIFTNISKDHIGKNEHSSMEDYVSSKKKLFSMCKNGIFNIDDKYFDYMKNNVISSINTFGKRSDSNLILDSYSLIRENNFLGVKLTTKGLINDTFLVSSPGLFSAYNAICAILVSYLLGCKIESIKEGLKRIKIKGRMEIVPIEKEYLVIIDYAHNGLSLENVLKTIKEYKHNNIISLFGCGGNRSVERRYDMGYISGLYSDYTIITEDNSRYEDVSNIMNDIEIGIKKTNGKYIKIDDRTKAIEYALLSANKGDIVLLLGKGHETYQDKNGIKIPYDERNIIKHFINTNKSKS